jgi:hypothetical protein
LERANLFNAHLEDTDLTFAHLEGAYIEVVHLEGANFLLSVLDDKTLIWKCTVDRITDFRGVGLGNVRIDPAIRALLEYNIRRMNWEDWYKTHPVLRWPVVCFWELSDYGRSTSRIILSFLVSALFFASVYTVFPRLMAGVSDGSFIHNLYISVTAMTSLGLSVGAAGKGCAARYCLLMAQYVFGYAILGALITRLNILFTAGGPSGDFTKPEGRTTVHERFHRIVSTLIHRKKHPAS